jgi:arsenite methyltransferase
VSDIALKRALPDELAKSVAAYVGCVAGAVPVADYERDLRAAGFDAVRVVDTDKDLNAYAKAEDPSGCCYEPATTSSTGLLIADESTPAGSEVHGGLTDLLRKYDVNEYAASVQVYAVKAR